MLQLSDTSNNIPRLNARISSGDRHRIIASFNRGEDFVPLANNAGIQRTRAYSIIRCFQKTGRIDTIHRGGRPSLMNKETLDLVIMLIEASPLHSLRSLANEVLPVFPWNLAFTISTLPRALKGELVLFKLSRDIPAEQNSQRFIADRKTCAEWMVGHGMQRHSVYIDETGFNFWTKRSFGRGRVGDRVNRQVGGQRGRNVTVIAAISDIEGLFYYEIHTTSVRKEISSGFIASLGAILGENRPIVILNNAPVHNRIIWKCTQTLSSDIYRLTLPFSIQMRIVLNLSRII